MKKKKQKVKGEVKTTENFKIDNKLLLYGIFFLILAFFLLKFTDPDGKNFYSFLSPLFFVISFVIISLSLDKEN